MTHVVLDVNTLVSGFRGVGDSPPVRLIEHWRGAAFTVAVSPHIIKKVLDVWERPYFIRYMTDELRAGAMALLIDKALWFDPDPSVAGVCDDWEDDLVLGTAVAAGADYLVTGDHGLLGVQLYGDASIVTARQFLTLLEGA